MRKTVEYIRQYYVFIIISILIIIPIAVYAGKSLPAADDFANAYSVRLLWEEHSSPLVAAFIKSYEIYRGISGYYYAAFLNFYFVPFLRYGITGLRVFNIIVNMLFFAAVWILIRTCSRGLLKAGEKYTWIVFCSFVFILTNGAQYSEVYTWYCVLAAYVLPLITIVAVIALMIYNDRKNSIPLQCGACILAFLASGSSLNVSALNCGLILLAATFYSFNNKKLDKSILIFIAALIGAIINVLSPGNYIRHGDPVTSGSVVEAAKTTIIFSLKQVEAKLIDTPFIIIFLIVIMASYIYIDYQDFNITFRFPLTGLIVVLFGVIIVNFPVFLGGYTPNVFPNRCVFIQDIALYFLIYMWILYFIGFLKTHCGRLSFSNENICIFSMSCIMAFTIFMGSVAGKDGITTEYMIKTILNGSLDKYVKSQELLLDYIQTSEDGDVVIKSEKTKANKLISPIGLSDKKEWWVNGAVAAFYGKNSVVLSEESKE